jgi:hypothetical protein
MRDKILFMIGRLHKFLYWFEWRFLVKEYPDDGTFIHLRQTEGNLRLNLVAEHDGEGNRCYTVDVERGCLNCYDWHTIARFEQQEIGDVTGMMQRAREEMERTPPTKASPFWLRNGLE